MYFIWIRVSRLYRQEKGNFSWTGKHNNANMQVKVIFTNFKYMSVLYQGGTIYILGYTNYFITYIPNTLLLKIHRQRERASEMVGERAEERTLPGGHVRERIEWAGGGSGRGVPPSRAGKFWILSLNHKLFWCTLVKWCVCELDLLNSGKRAIWIWSTKINTKPCNVLELGQGN